MDGLNGPLPLPEELSELPDLRALRLRGNFLTGTIPEIYGRLEHLDLANNSLSGTIPIAVLTGNVSFITLSENSLTGTIATEIGLSVITGFTVSDNALSGSIPSELFGRQANTSWLFLQGNRVR
jgi:Leucine-rich repeat (LRR) protein